MKKTKKLDKQINNLSTRLILQEDQPTPDLSLGGFSGDVLRKGTGASPLYKKEEPQQYSGSEILNAAWERENSIGSAITSLNTRGGEEDPDYDVIEKIRGTKYESRLYDFERVRNDYQLERVKANIDREERNEEILYSSGGWGMAATLGVSILDPVNFIPVGGTAYKAFRFGGVATGALRTAEAGLVSSVASEAVLQSTQLTRTKQESIINVAAGTVLSGILGGAAAKLSKADFQNLAKKTQDELAAEKADIEINPNTQQIEDSVGAKRLFPYEDLHKEHIAEMVAKGKKPLDLPAFTNKMESLSAGTLGLAKGLSKSISFINPLQRVFNAEIASPKELLQELATHNMIVGKNEAGIASQQAVETEIKRWKAGLGEAIPRNRELFKSFKQRMKAEGQEVPFKNQIAFNEEVSKSLRRGDKSQYPEIEQAAKFWRAKVFDPAKEGAIAVKLLPEDVKPETATSYLTRLWNKQAIVDEEQELRDLIKDRLENVAMPQAEAASKQRELNLLAGVNDYRARIAELENGLAPEVIPDNEAINILNRYKEASNTLRTVKPKPLLQFIKENGGIYDRKGELAVMGITNKTHPFTIRTASAKGIEYDDVTRRAWESGYFPEYKERPPINALLDAIDEEVRGSPRFSDSDLNKLELRDQANDFIEQLDREGIDIKALQENLGKKVQGKPFKDILAQNEIKNLKKSIERLEARIEKNNAKFAEFDDPAARGQYILDVVDSIMSNLKGESRFNSVANYDFKITKRGPLKERTLSFIRDEEVEQYLENDIETIANRYTKIMGTDIELARKFDGDVNLEKRLAKIKEDYEDLAEKNPDRAAKIQKEKENVLRDLQALRDIQRGVYAQPDNPDALIVRAGRVARHLNYASKLGGVVVSSIADTTRAISIHGLGAFSKGLKAAVTNTKGIKLNVKEAKQAGNVVERVLNTRLATLAEITDPLNSSLSAFEKFVQNVSNLSTKLNGIALWNDIQKGFNSVLTQQRIIEEVDNLLSGKIKTKDRTYLAFLGIDKDNADIIKDQLKKHAFKEDDLWVANTEKWTDPQAVRLYRNALNQDVDRSIVTKTAGDIPLMMNTEIGKTIGQFKSFTFAATQQVLMAGLQQRDANALIGLITSIGMGMLVYKLKTAAAKKETSDDPRKWIAEGIDRSGYLGIIMEANNIAEKMTRGTVGINALIGGEMMSRYVSRNGAGALAGPSAGFIGDIYQITGAIATGEITESDLRAFRRNIPFQNNLILRRAFDELEESIGKNL